jgi:hypothetical protein
MEVYGGPAQPSPTTGHASTADSAFRKLSATAARPASLPLDAIRRPRDTPLWKLEASLKCRNCRYAAGAHDQADRDAGDHAVQVGTSE